MPQLVDLNEVPAKVRDSKESFALDVLHGLSSFPKIISPKYFYDDIGSELFKKITDSADYYPTRCEYEILETHKSAIGQLIRDNDVNLIELGAGDGRKTKVLVEELMKSTKSLSYCPIDISRAANEELVERFTQLFPDLSITGVIGEYFRALDWIRDHKAGKNFVLFLGSNIGNFTIPQAKVFLRSMWSCLNEGDYALIGFDLKKDIDLMLRAYNDSHGLTKEFNLNLLDRINKELKGTFNRKNFMHFGTYNVHLGAMESFLVSLVRQEVEIGFLNKKFQFKPYESIHVEHSFKFLPSDIESLAKDTGFKLKSLYFDSKEYFVDAVFEVEHIR